MDGKTRTSSDVQSIRILEPSRDEENIPGAGIKPGRIPGGCPPVLFKDCRQPVFGSRLAAGRHIRTRTQIQDVRLPM